MEVILWRLEGRKTMTKKSDFGSIKTRLNKKTNKTEYKIDFKYLKGYDQEGKAKWSGSSVGWDEDLETLKVLAQERRKELESGEESETFRKLNSTLEEAFLEFKDSLYKRAEKETDKYTTRKSYASEANTIYNSREYFPDRYRKIKIRELKAHHFSQWLVEMNENAKSGSTIRKYRAILGKFNNYLNAHGYYETKEGMMYLVKTYIDSVELMAKDEGSRSDLYTPNIADIQKITDKIKKQAKKGHWRYENFYWYTLVKTFFFIGGRPEEMVALKWSNVDMKTKNIFITNAIADKTPEEIIKEREKKKQRGTKTRSSARTIRMMNVYEELLADFKEASKYYFDYSDEELENAYVFPRVDKQRVRKSKQEYKNINNMLEDICKKAGVTYFSVERFRHGCATLFLLNKEFDVGLDEARDYFGHEKDSSDMLEKIYAKKDATQKGSKAMEKRNASIFAKSEINEENDEIKKLIRDIFDEDRIKDKSLKARKRRIAWQVANAISRDQAYYVFKKKDEKIIDWIIEQYEKSGDPIGDKIILVCEDDLTEPEEEIL